MVNSAKTAMTLTNTVTKYITDEEWNELVALKEAIHDNPASVSTHKMELFTELFVRSLYGKSDIRPE